MRGLGRFILFILFFSVAPQLCEAQKTRVSGTIKDALTYEAIPFASVHFKGTTIATTSNFEGQFSLETAGVVDSVIASFIGYLPVSMPVKNHKDQVINIVMTVNKVDLPEVKVLPGKNPALVLLEKIIENKDQNNREKLSAYQYEVYNKVEFDINDINASIQKNILLKPFSFIFDEYMDTTSTNKKPFLPIFISENLSDFYSRQNPKYTKEFIKGSRVSGMDNPTITQFLGDMYETTNIYDNHIIVFKKSFISPLANDGEFYYRYYLVDSAFFGNKWCYKVTFQPRRKQELTFIGDFWVNDTTFAIKKVNARLAEGVNVNFVDDLAVVQEFEQEGSQWMISQDAMVVDFNVRDKGMSFIGRKTTSYHDVIVNEPKSIDFFLKDDNIVVTDSALKRNVAYWQANRHDSLSLREKRIYEMVDTIKSLPAFRTWIDIITLFVTGYREWGVFELGPYFTFFSFNALEGPRLRIGGRTGNKFSTNLILSGYVAYGTRDEAFKYSGGAQYFFSKKPRNSLKYSYKYDVEQLGQSENAFQDDNILSSVSRRSPTLSLTRLEENNLQYEYEWYPGFSSKVSLTHRFYNPVEPLDYSYYSEFPDTLFGIKNSLNTSEIGFFTRFAYREKFVAGKVDRMSLGTKYPIFQIKYTLGLRGTLGSDFEYHKVSLKINHYFHLGYLGWTEYVAEVGKIWGTLPYPLLEVHQGNESYSYDYMAFNMMNYFEFVSDQYASLFVTHHFEGLFLNRIPLMRKLKWREVATAKIVEGSLSMKNSNILVSENRFSTLHKPYSEVGVGIENIFKIFRVDLLWRLTYRDGVYIEHYSANNKSKISRLGLRASLQFFF